MALVIPKITKDLESAILNALKKEYKDEAKADSASHKKLAAAIASGVAQVLIKALQTEAEVMPGIPTAGSPAAQITTSFGKIF